LPWHSAWATRDASKAREQPLADHRGLVHCVSVSRDVQVSLWVWLYVGPHVGGTVWLKGATWTAALAGTAAAAAEAKHALSLVGDRGGSLSASKDPCDGRPDFWLLAGGWQTKGKEVSLTCKAWRKLSRIAHLNRAYETIFNCITNIFNRISIPRPFGVGTGEEAFTWRYTGSRQASVIVNSKGDITYANADSWTDCAGTF
jgi:hypothetical protein